MGGRWRYKLTVSSNLQTVQCKHVRIHGWTLALQTSSVLYDLYNADISEIIGGRWRYKLQVSLNFTTAQCRHIRVHGWTLELQTSSVRLLYKLHNADISEFMGGSAHYTLLMSSNFQSVQCRHIRIHGWTFALQASSVLKFFKLYNADISEFMGGCWRSKLPVSLVSLNFTDCAMQTYQNSWVEVCMTNF